MRVQDFKGDEIKVGTKVVFGSPETPEELASYTGEVTEIGEPDIIEAEDAYGRYQAVAYGLEIVVSFSDGDTEKVWCAGRAPQSHGEEIFEASDDIEVAA